MMDDTPSSAVPPPELSLTSSQLLDRIAKTQLEMSPFPHLYLDHLLPSAIMAKVLEHWPADEVFTPYSDARDRKIGDAGRFGFYVMGHTAAERAASLDAECRRFWKEFSQYILKPIAAGAFHRLFAGLQARFNRVDDLDLETFAVLVNSYQCLDVGVHTDMPAFVLSILVYIDEIEGLSGGTSLYEPKDREFCHPGDNFLDRGLFRRSKTFPYRAGSVIAMLCTGNSYHGVEPIKVSDSSHRRTINMHIRLTENGIEQLYGAANLAGFIYPIQVEPYVLEALDHWQQVESFESIAPTAVDMAAVERSFLYGKERL